ncbi:hypothetical protein Q7I34_16845 [Aeromonas veronii]|uniref:hypothetical protein n=1 Tax=Aeromonas veronii TaxID=654 RepID=UPI0015FF13B0|nr:hypothetical protein [Aeromonas veronii]MBL0631471.1 hypothetical protein [Aeromonas veronii]
MPDIENRPDKQGGFFEFINRTSWLSVFADIDILVLLADLEELVQIGHHQLDQLGVEMQGESVNILLN